MKALVIRSKLLKLWHLRKEKVLEELNRELRLCDSVQYNTHPAFTTSGILGWIIGNPKSSIEEYRNWQKETKEYAKVRKCTVEKRIELVHELKPPAYTVVDT